MRDTLRKFKPPVTWLLGSRFVASLRQALRYVVLGTKADARAWMRPEPIVIKPRDGEAQEYWFDYVADCGDGQAATYSLACLLMEEHLELRGETLPRGEFLLFGGDTAYHVADYATLDERLRRPFLAAAETIGFREDADEPRPLFGIPGNHDYYDLLDGFNRQFRRPYSEDVLDESHGSANDTAPRAQLHLPGLKRAQEASFLALDLPFGWHLWGLDAQQGVLDRRQRYFFSERKKDLLELREQGKPLKMIVVTPEPTTVFEQRCKEDAPIVETMRDIGLGTPFLDGGRLLGDDDGCRLDLSGDIHHYARYWGPSDRGEPSSYASVVAGGGGAFLHPSQTFIGGESERVESERIWPEHDDSHAEVMKRLLNPLTFLRSGWKVLALGAVLASVIALAAVVPTTAKPLMHELVRLVGAAAGLPRIEIAPAGALATFASGLGPSSPGLELRSGASLPPLGLLAVVVGLFWLDHRRRSHIDGDRRERERLAHRRHYGHAQAGQPARSSWWARHGSLVLQVSVLVAVAAMVAFSPDRQAGTWVASLWLAVTLALGVIGAVWRAMHLDWCYRQTSDHVPRWQRSTRALIALWSLVVPMTGLVLFGGRSVTLAAIEIALFATLAFVLLVAFAAAKGGGIHHPWPMKLLFGLVALWLGLGQLILPGVHAASNDCCLYLAWLTAVSGATGLALWLGPSVARWARPERRRWPLGVFMLALWVGSQLLPIRLFVSEPISVSFELLDFVTLAGFASLFMAVHFGWYLAVALAFNGHNNEAGGAARLDRYRHFLRIRVTPTAVTVYAIGFKEPLRRARSEVEWRESGLGDLSPVLVDEFTLVERESCPRGEVE